MGIVVWKAKTKLLLIEYFIKLNKISFLCDKNDERQCVKSIKELNSQLLEIYEKIFFKFGIMDYSFLVLKNSLNKSADKSSNVRLSESELKKVYLKLKELASGLMEKLKKLALNDVEMQYLIHKLSL